MAAIEAHPINNRDYAWKLIVRGPEARGTKFFRVNTAVHAEAMKAPGLPAYQEKWDHNYETLKSVGMETIYEAGRVEGDMTGGLTIVQVDYETASWSGSGLLPIVGSRWTEIGGGVDSKHADYPVGAVIGTNKLNNGKGTNVEVGTTVATVTRIFAPNESPGSFQGLLTRLLNLKAYQLLNADQLALPPVRYTGVVWTLDPGQIRFNDYTLKYDQGVLFLEMILKLAPDHDFYETPDSEFGSASVAAPIRRPVYQFGDLRGLW